MSKTFSTADVASHNKGNDMYIIVDEDVYDLTTFQDEHPGGKKILQRVAGKDASKQFWKYHNEGILKKYKAKLQVGSLDTKKAEAKPAPAAPATTAEKKEVVVPSAESGHVAPAPGPAAHEQASEAMEPFGDLIPFADPNWYQSVGAFAYLGRIKLLTSVAVSFTLLQRVSCRPSCRGPRMG